MRVNREKLQEAKNKVLKEVPLSLAISKLGYTMGLTSGKIKCPIHDDSSPSFFYDDELQTFHCFGCQRSGTIIDLHRYLEEKEGNSIAYDKALLDVAKEYNVSIPDIFSESEIKRLERKKSERVVVDSEFREKRELQKYEEAAKRYSIKTQLNIYGLLDKYYMGFIDRSEALIKIKKVANRETKKL